MMGQVYKIHNLINNKVYIGQTYKRFEDRYGVNGIKSVLTVSKNEHLKNSIKKYGTDCWEISILEETESREELNIYEDLYIIKYNSTDKRFGYNKKTGGDTWKFTEETKEKMRLINIEMRGKKVICLNNLKVYDSVSTAARELNANPDNIRNACKGRSVTAYGLKWEYYDETKSYKKDDSKFKPSFEKMVVRLNDKKIYETVKDSALDVGVSSGAIISAIKSKSTVKGVYQYAYYNSDIPINALKTFKKKSSKMIRNISTGDIYNSVNECAEALGVSACTVTSAIKNYRNAATSTCRGFNLEYINIYDLPKTVINVSTGRLYETISSAALDTGLDRELIYKCIVGEILDIDGEHWDYYCDGDSYWLKESSSYSYKYRPVININTGEIFFAIKFAVKKYDIGFKEIQSSCSGETYTGGGYQWAYWEEGKVFELKKVRKNTSRVICYTTGEVFDSIEEASKKYNITRGNITMVCQGKDRGAKRKFCGIHPVTGEKLRWGYLDEPKQQITNREVKCVETGVVYRSLSHAQEKTGIQKGNIRHVCNGTRKKAGGFTWVYVETPTVEYDVRKIRKHPNEKKVLCLNDGIVHDNISTAANYYGIKSKSNLSLYLSGKNKNRHVRGYKFVYFNKDYNFVLTPKNIYSYK